MVVLGKITLRLRLPDNPQLPAAPGSSLQPHVMAETAGAGIVIPGAGRTLRRGRITPFTNLGYFPIPLPSLLSYEEFALLPDRSAYRVMLVIPAKSPWGIDSYIQGIANTSPSDSPSSLYVATMMRSSGKQMRPKGVSPVSVVVKIGSARR
jgi:hypothetical protein